MRRVPAGEDHARQNADLRPGEQVHALVPTARKAGAVAGRGGSRFKSKTSRLVASIDLRILDTARRQSRASQNYVVS